jgi:hypothetical protein
MIWIAAKSLLEMLDSVGKVVGVIKHLFGFATTTTTKKKKEVKEQQKIDQRKVDNSI